MEDNFYSLISRHFPLGKQSSKGFYLLKCPVCQDSKVRAGFKFDGSGFGYNCFRGKCGHRFRWLGGMPNENLTRKMDQLFSAVGLREEDWMHLCFEDSGNPEEMVRVLAELKRELPEAFLPKGSTLLTDCDTENPRTKMAIEFLLHRGIDPLCHPFYLTHDHPVRAKGELDFRERIIIPFLQKGRTIFYQGRWYHPTIKCKGPKYLNSPNLDRDQVFFNLDEIHRQVDTPLVVAEGVFDALMLNGISALSNVLTEEQIRILHQSPRRLIFVPDHDFAGQKMVDQAIQEDWDVSFPDWGSCDDLGDAVAKYGKYRAAGFGH